MLFPIALCSSSGTSVQRQGGLERNTVIGKMKTQKREKGLRIH